MPSYFQVTWDHEDDYHGNIQRIAEHALAMEDVEHVFNNPTGEGGSHSSGLPCCFVYTADGRYIIVVYEQVDEDSICPVTAYDVPEPA